jgi:hypothetical protein
MKKQYTKQQIAEAIKYWQSRLDALDNGRQVKESSSKRAYLDSVLPKNGITLYDDAGKKLNFEFKLNSGMAAGWTGVDKQGNVVCLSDWNSGYDGKDISVPLLSMFLKDYGYELVDER